jgi:hypothetical protein
LVASAGGDGGKDLSARSALTGATASATTVSFAGTSTMMSTSSGTAPGGFGGTWGANSRNAMMANADACTTADAAHEIGAIGTARAV